MSNKIITPLEALEKGRSFCAYQERSQHEVIEKLKSFRLTKDELNYVLLQLIQGDYLNEERFARAYATGKHRIKKWGRRKIKHQLKLKGLTDKCIQLGLSEIDPDEYLQNLEQLALHKQSMIKESNAYRKKQKLIAYLYGKGYESDLIQETLNTIINIE